MKRILDGNPERRHTKDTAWHYYNGRRWLPASEVNDILIVQPGKVWIATPEGISEIRNEQTTLHGRPVITKPLLTNVTTAAGSSILQAESTGRYLHQLYRKRRQRRIMDFLLLAAQCFRYAVTKEAQAKEKLSALLKRERLETITGIPGYPARSYAAAKDKVGSVAVAPSQTVAFFQRRQMAMAR